MFENTSQIDLWMERDCKVTIEFLDLTPIEVEKANIQIGVQELLPKKDLKEDLKEDLPKEDLVKEESKKDLNIMADYKPLDIIIKDKTQADVQPEEAKIIVEEVVLDPLLRYTEPIPNLIIGPNPPKGDLENLIIIIIIAKDPLYRFEYNANKHHLQVLHAIDLSSTATAKREGPYKEFVEAASTYYFSIALTTNSLFIEGYSISNRLDIHVGTSKLYKKLGLHKFIAHYQTKWAFIEPSLPPLYYGISIVGYDVNTINEPPVETTKFYPGKLSNLKYITKTFVKTPDRVIVTRCWTEAIGYMVIKYKVVDNVFKFAFNMPAVDIAKMEGKDGKRSLVVPRPPFTTFTIPLLLT